VYGLYTGMWFTNQTILSVVDSQGEENQVISRMVRDFHRFRRQFDPPYTTPAQVEVPPP
jgi:hypothetical protein